MPETSAAADSQTQGGLITAYGRLLRKRPIATSLASGAVTLFVGDLAAQCIEMGQHHRTGIDGVRSVVVLTWAVLGDMPLNLALFYGIEKVLVRCGVQKGRTTLPLSVLRACCFTIPGALLRNPLYITYTSVSEHLFQNVVAGQPLDVGWSSCVEALWERLVGRDLREILRNSLLVWLPANTFNFQCVPAHFRPIFTSCVQVCWNTYLSLTSHRPLAPAQEGSGETV